jgi:1-acyl-sn-glycerol-3-phosphate acyltransferase
MKTFKLCYRLVVFSLVTIFLYVILSIGKLVLFFSRNQRIRWRKLIVQTWANMVAMVLNMQIHVKGRPPQPPFYLVSNHLSYLDVIVFFTQIHCIFVAMAELERWPIFGLLAKSANTVFIDRRNKKDIMGVNMLIERAIHESGGIIVFPESAITKGNVVLPFKTALLEYAAEKSFAVSYATLHYRTAPPDPPAYLSVCWWDDITFGSHAINLLKLSKIEVTVEFGQTTVRGNDRKLIAKELWHLINRQFVPTYDS